MDNCIDRLSALLSSRPNIEPVNCSETTKNTLTKAASLMILSTALAGNSSVNASETFPVHSVDNAAELTTLAPQSNIDNDYGFMSATSVHNTIQIMSGHKPVRDFKKGAESLTAQDIDNAKEKMAMLKDISPLMKNNEHAMKIVINDPEEYNSSLYNPTPLSHSEKLRANKLSIDELKSASAGEILYRTTDLPLALPGNENYEQIRELTALRTAAMEFISKVKSPDELNSLMDKNIQNENLISDAYCKQTGGVFIDESLNDKSGYEVCMDEIGM